MLAHVCFQNNAAVREKLWNGVDCILLMLLSLVKAPVCIFMCPHKLTNSDNVLVQTFCSCSLLSQGNWKLHQDKLGWRHGAWAGPMLSKWSQPDGAGEKEDGEQTSKLVSKL